MLNPGSLQNLSDISAINFPVANSDIILSEKNMKLDEDNFTPVNNFGFFKEYIEKSTKTKYSAFETTINLVSPNIKGVFIEKVESYIKIQDQADDLLKVHGYFIKEKNQAGKNTVISKEVVVLIELVSETLSELKQREDLTKSMCMELASAMSLALHTLERLKFKVSYICPQDVVIVTNNGHRHFKFFGIQNSGSAGNVPAISLEWTSPELFLRSRLFKNEESDPSKSLNYSLGILVLFAGTKQARPTAHRSLYKEVTAIQAEMQKEPVIIDGLINNVIENYNLTLGDGASNARDVDFVLKLRGSLAYDKFQRSDLEFWLQQNTQYTPKSSKRGSIIHPAAIEIPSKKQTLHAMQIAGDNHEDNEMSIQPSRGATMQKQPTVKQSIREEKPTLFGQIRSYISKIELNEMAPFTFVVGIFCGMIFIGIITVILLTAG